MTNKQAAIEILEKLRENDFEALLAGGCVRDMLLARPAKDYDVVTSAQPRDVIRLFKRTLTIGAHFGVVIVMIANQKVEVATFRSDIGYADGRHPTKVKFVTAAEDAARRDFTINGMFYDPIEDKVIDYVNGQEDLKKKTVRTIGNPDERFSEDYLRMLRAVRFATQLDFKIEPQTWDAIKQNAKNIIKISDERKQMELEGILVDPNRSLGAAMLIKTGLAEAVFPGFAGKEAKLSIHVLSQLQKKVDFPLALACFFVGFDAEFALEKCVTLRLSKNQNKHIKFLLANRDKLLKDHMPLADLRKLFAEPYFWDLYEFQKAVQKASPSDKAGAAALMRTRQRLKSLKDLEVKPKPLLNGHELIQLGAAPGPRLGQLTEEMYVAQLEGHLETVEQAQDWVRKWLQKHQQINHNNG